MGLTGWKPKPTPNGTEATAICVFFTLGFIVLGSNPTAATYSNSRLFRAFHTARSAVSLWSSKPGKKLVGLDQRYFS